MRLPNWLLPAVAAVFAAGAVAGGVAAYSVYGSYGDLQAAHAEQGAHWTEVLRRHEGLMEARAFAERQRQVAEQTLEHMRDMLKAREREVRVMRESMGLYEKLMEPKGMPGLRVHRLSVAATPEAGQWDYRLVLYQKGRSKPVQGRYDLLFHGRTSRGAVRHRLSELASGEHAGTFAFLHFAVLHGQFRLPKEFEVERVEVEVAPAHAPEAELRANFGWKEAIEDSG